MAMDTWPRFDVETRDLAGGHIEVYRRKDKLGSGPCLSLYAGDVEVMRFDLFDPAHEHWATGSKIRLYYPPGVDRFEIAVWHLRYYSPFAAELAGAPPVSVTDADAAWTAGSLHRFKK